ncbi:mCG147647 [Mus musculus]|nr:mCG147647 [Mus musculus]
MPGEVAWPALSGWGLRVYKQTSLGSQGPLSSIEVFLQ